jgi:hypothetical protein
MMIVNNKKKKKTLTWKKKTLFAPNDNNFKATFVFVTPPLE